MSLQDGRGRLYSSVKTLLAHWDQTDPQWRDTMKTQFVEQVLLPLQEHTAAVLEAADRMDVLLHEMRRDCEGDNFDIHGND